MMKIENLFQRYNCNSISLTNFEIFDIFRYSQKTILFLIQKKMLNNCYYYSINDKIKKKSKFIK